ncbi:MAG: hypothetical protein AB7F31_07020 [Parachlamydiales bacterium]
MHTLFHRIADFTRDPGMGRAVHALKSVGGVGLAYLLIDLAGVGHTVFGLMAAAILSQCTVGNSSRQRKISMAIAGFGGGALALIGSLASYHHLYGGYAWMAVIALLAYMAAGLGGRWVVMPRFVTTLVIFGTILSIPFEEIVSASLSYLIGFGSAFLVYFYVLPDHKIPLLQSTLHLTFGRIADMVEAETGEAARVASEMLGKAQQAMLETRSAHWNQSDLVDATSEIVLLLRELYTDGRYLQRYLISLRKEGGGERYFAIGRQAARGLRAAGVAVNVASQRSTLPVYEAIDRGQELLQGLVGSIEEEPVNMGPPQKAVRAFNFVAAAQNLWHNLTRAAELIDRLQHPMLVRKR